MKPTGPDATWLVDASVALKWFMPRDREPDADLARSAVGQLAMRTTTLAIYEIGNILTRKSGWKADRIALGLKVLHDICGDPLDLEPDDRQLAAEIALTHDITFYDASYAAIAQRTKRQLLSADRDLVRPGLAQSLQSACT
ncbi:MAG: type II toxin-antitoxin system VapC family toxin [Actinomycetota bacterium]|nr:type II toxin-antitoxin system VapC family toxin [Actinomycetota bacterium]